MTVQTRERITYVLVSLCILGGTFFYARQWDLMGQWNRYQASEQQKLDAQQQLATMQDKLHADRARAANMDKDPVEKEATVRRVSKGVRADEIVFRVEEEAPAQK